MRIKKKMVPNFFSFPCTFEEFPASGFLSVPYKTLPCGSQHPPGACSHPPGLPEHSREGKVKVRLGKDTASLLPLLSLTPQSHF